MVHVHRAARALAFAACGLVFAFPGQAQQSHPPAEAFGQLPALTQPELSPDGKHLAAVQSHKGRPAAVIYDLDTKPTPAPLVLPYKDGIIEGVNWANNDRLLITINMNVIGDYDLKVNAWFRTLSVDVHGQNAVLLFANSASRNFNYSASGLVDVDLDDPDHVFMSLWNVDGYFDPTNTIYRIDVNSGNAEVFVRGSSKTSGWIMDGHGNVVGRVDRDKNPLVDHLLLKHNDDWTEIAKYDATGARGANLIGLNTDGTALVQVVAFENSGTDGLAQIALAGGKVTPAFDNPRYDVGGVLIDPWTRRVSGVVYADDKEEYLYFDPKMEALQKGLEVAFPGTSVHAVSWNTALDRLVVEVADPRLPVAYYILDRTTHQATSVGRTYPNLTDADIGEIKPYPYKARDGLDIPAYITLPPGRTPKNLPAVVMPHGGPDFRDGLGFDWWAQFLANRGYVVLQPNFRGSSGYGDKFTEAGLHQWGLKMQDDITDGVRKMVADGIVDPKRVCIVGASYGGYVIDSLFDSNLLWYGYLASGVNS